MQRRLFFSLDMYSPLWFYVPTNNLKEKPCAYITVQKISINNKKNNPSILKKWQQEH